MVVRRASATVPAVNCEAFKLINAEPFPLNAPLNAPEKLFPPLVKLTGFEYVPDTWLDGTVPVNCAADNVPAKLLAVVENIAYGTGKTGWRGESEVKFVTPTARTPRSSQALFPAKTPAPKSRVTLKSPLLTATAELVSSTLMRDPLVTAS